jgi:hypothetical protein
MMLNAIHAADLGCIHYAGQRSEVVLAIDAKYQAGQKLGLVPQVSSLFRKLSHTLRSVWSKSNDRS